MCVIGDRCSSVTKAAFSMVYKTIRDNFTHQVAVILACYRKQCSSQSPPGQVSVQIHTQHSVITLFPQLILPESLKLMPMYANCLLKSDALLARKYIGREYNGFCGSSQAAVLP